MNSTNLKGKLLVASPRLLDPNFARSVLLMVDHSETGALGLIINRPTGLSVKELWAQVSEADCAVRDIVYAGGPCTGTLMVLHSESACSQIQVMDAVHFSSEISQITSLVSANAWPIKVFYGYAGWGAGQLEGEMATGSWLVFPAGLDQVFGDPDNLWDSLIAGHYQSLGLGSIKPRFIPRDPSMN
jgi:putative transcriptional regulator